MKWIVTLCAIAVVGLVGLYGLYRTQLVDESFDPGHPQGFWIEYPLYTLSIPGVEQELDEIREAAWETCASQDVEQLAAGLRTAATPEAVARRYAQKAVVMAYPKMTSAQSADARRAVYEGCMGRFEG